MPKFQVTVQFRAEAADRGQALLMATDAAEKYVAALNSHPEGAAIVGDPDGKMSVTVRPVEG